MADTPVVGNTSFRAKGPSYIATIAIGHGIKHWYLAAFAVFLPLIKDEFALSAIGVSVLVTLRQVGGGIPNFFVGYVTDRLRGRWNVLLPVSLISAAAAYVAAALSPWYWPLVVFIALAGVSAAFWHPAAISMLSTRFPTRRGMAIAFHGSGSGAGEALGPLGVGFILITFLNDDWRAYAIISMVPAVAFGLLLYWMLSGTESEKREEDQPPAALGDIFKMMRYPVLRTLAIANFTRSFAHFGVLAFLPIYLADDLGMDSSGVGLHVGLLTLLGVGVGPLFGHFSDHVGRRMPIVGAMVVITVGMLAMGIVQSGIPLTIAIALTGIFLWSVQDVINAAAMDAAPSGYEGTVVGFMFTSSFVAGIFTPFIMGIAITLTGSNLVIFYIAAAVAGPATLYFLIAPLNETEADQVKKDLRSAQD